MPRRPNKMRILKAKYKRLQKNSPIKNITFKEFLTNLSQALNNIPSLMEEVATNLSTLLNDLFAKKL